MGLLQWVLSLGLACSHLPGAKTPSLPASWLP